MKKKISLLMTSILLICCLFTAACDDNSYTSSYKAMGFVYSNTDDAASMKFSEFQGVKVFEVKFKDSFSKSLLYKLNVEVGSATIYYDTDGTKTELVTVDSGNRVDDKLNNLTCESMYIIVEANEKCINGEFNFETEVL